MLLTLEQNSSFYYFYIVFVILIVCHFCITLVSYQLTNGRTYGPMEPPTDQRTDGSIDGQSFL